MKWAPLAWGFFLVPVAPLALAVPLSGGCGGARGRPTALPPEYEEPPMPSWLSAPSAVPDAAADGPGLPIVLAPLAP